MTLDIDSKALMTIASPDVVIDVITAHELGLQADEEERLGLYASLKIVTVSPLIKGHCQRLNISVRAAYHPWSLP